MFKPLLQSVRYKTNALPPVRLGDGINQSGDEFSIKPSEARDCMNVSGKHYPSLEVRPGRQNAFAQVTKLNALGQRNNEFPHIQDGTVWRRWDGSAWQTISEGLADASGKIVEFSTGTTKYTLLFNGTNKLSWDGSTIIDLTNAPATRLLAVHKSRLYAFTENDIKFCNINLLNDWTTVNATGLIDVTKAKGPITAGTEYADHVLVFTQFSMHELYGTGPINYQLVDITNDIGCVSDKSIAECKGKLFWLSMDRVNMYTGSQPSKVSDKVDGYIKGINPSYRDKCVAGVLGESYFLSIVYGAATTNNIILELDTRTGNWYVHSGNIIDFVAIGDKLYGVDSSGKFWDMENGIDDAGAQIEWNFETGPQIDGSIARGKTASDIWLAFLLPVGSSMSLYCSESVNADDFTLLETFTPSASPQDVRVQVPTTVLQNASWYRLKFIGKGLATIYYLEKRVRIKER